MNAPAQFQAALAESLEETEQARLREIPYNYTSFSDREIVLRVLGPNRCNQANQRVSRSRVRARLAPIPMA